MRRILVALPLASLPASVAAQQNNIAADRLNLDLPDLRGCIRLRTSCDVSF